MTATPTYYRYGTAPAGHMWRTENQTALRQLTFPKVYPIDRDDAAEYAKIGACNCEDRYIDTLLAAATAYVEDRIGICGIKRQYEAVYDTFPPSVYGFAQEMSRAPLVSVESVEYLDESEVRQTLGTDVWEAVIGSEIRGWVQLRFGQTWPHTAIDRHAAVWITFTAGYGDTPEDLEGLPNIEQIRHAIRLLILHWTNYGRDPVQPMAHRSSEIPFAITNLIDSARPGYYRY